MKKTGLVLFLTLLVGLFAVSAQAEKGEKCGWGNKGKFGKEGGAGDLLTAMVANKASFYISHAKQIGLNSAQIERVRTTRTDLQKKVIKDEAEVKTIKLDILSEIHKENPDPTKIQSLIDKKHDVKKEMEKASLQALLDLKGLLTPEQQEKAKALWKHDKKAPKVSEKG